MSEETKETNETVKADEKKVTEAEEKKEEVAVSTEDAAPKKEAESTASKSVSSTPEEIEVIPDVPIVDQDKKDELFKPIVSVVSKQRKTLRKKTKIVEPIELKADTIAKFQKHKKDFGSTEVQIALVTQRILHLTEHLKIHTKDKHTNYGLIKLVSKRKKLMNYLNNTNPTKLKEIKTALNLR